MIKYQNKRVIEDGDFDDLVEKTYGRTYRFQQQAERLIDKHAPFAYTGRFKNSRKDAVRAAIVSCEFAISREPSDTACKQIKSYLEELL